MGEEQQRVMDFLKQHIATAPALALIDYLSR